MSTSQISMMMRREIVMINRLPESRAWRNLVVLPSMDVIDADAMTNLGLRSANFPALQEELRKAVTASNFDPDASRELWQAALDGVGTSLGPQVRADFETWGNTFPCDADTILPELDAWERTWPDLANVLRASQSASPWGECLSDLYRSAMRKSGFEEKLEGRLSHPLSDWDKTCFTHYADADLTSEGEFFTTLTLGADRLQLARFWKNAAALLSGEQKCVIWKLGQDIWAQMHSAMTDDDLKEMRGEFSDEEDFREAFAFLDAYRPRTVELPHPDILLIFA